MDDMFAQHETPTGDAAAKVGHYLTGTLAAADASVRLLTWLRCRVNAQDQAQEQEVLSLLEPGDLERAGKLLDPRREAHDAMRGRWKHPISGLGWYRDVKRQFDRQPQEA